MKLLSVITVIINAQITLLDLHESAEGLQRTKRMAISHSACGVPCQRFPHPIKKRNLIKIVGKAIGLPASKIRLVGPEYLIGSNYIDIGSCMGNCVRSSFMANSHTKNTCQVAEKEDLIISVDGKEIVIPGLLIESCTCGLSFSCQGVVPSSD